MRGGRATLRIAVLLGLTLAPLALANITNGRADLRITIRVVNPRVVPAQRLARAEKIAGHILGRAGVEVNWVECAAGEAASGIPDACQQDLVATVLRIQMLRSRPADFHGDVTGFAVLTPHWRNGESYAAVSYPMVEDSARSLEGEVSNVLGATIAHEIGHLLLGAKSHSASGVMSPRIEREQLRVVARGELLFTALQASRIRAEIARRIAAAGQDGDGSHSRD
jgi:hypothetical protein